MRIKLFFVSTFLLLSSTVACAQPALSGLNVKVNFVANYGGSFQSMTISNFYFANPNIPRLIGVLNYDPRLSSSFSVPNEGIFFNPAMTLVTPGSAQPTGNFKVAFSPVINGGPANLVLGTTVNIGQNPGTPTTFPIGTASCTMTVTNPATLNFVCNPAN